MVDWFVFVIYAFACGCERVWYDAAVDFEFVLIV